MEMGYVYATVTALFGVLLAVIARLIVSWLKTKADTTDTPWDDITIPVSVAYGSDSNKVKAILLDIARDVIGTTQYLLTDPAPKVFFLEFGDSRLKFVLYVWAKAYNLPDEVKDAVNSRIAERFSAEGIGIPFPQLEVSLKK